MKDLNEAFVHLNVGLPDDVERLKAAGYYKEAMARIDEYLAEDWTETQNSPRSQGLEMPEYEQPANPVPHGVDALRDALLVQKEIMCRLPQEYCWNEAQAVARMQGLVRDFTVEEFRQLVHEGRVDWRFVEGEKHYLDRFAETLPTLPPVSSTRPPRLRWHGSAAAASMTRWSGKGRPVPASR